jgi:hypothetical protein
MALPGAEADRDGDLVQALRDGDDQTFARIIDEWSSGW